MMSNLLELRGVRKAFGRSEVLNGVSLSVRRGEALGIVGPSGTGKSTVLRLLAGLAVPDEGSVLVQGQSRPGCGLLSDRSEQADETAEAVRVGMVFQSAALFDSLTVEQNVGFTLLEKSVLPRADIRAAVQDVLSAVGLEGCADMMPDELSGGMRKRVALARAIMPEPDEHEDEHEVVLYDEVTAGLDPVASTAIENLMRDIHSSRSRVSSYVVVTHQLSTLRRAVDRILFLHKGEIVWEGTSAEFDNASDPLVRQFARGDLEGPLGW